MYWQRSSNVSRLDSSCSGLISSSPTTILVPSQLQGQATNHAHARQCGTGDWLLLPKKASPLPRRQRDREALAPFHLVHLAHLPNTLGCQGHPWTDHRRGPCCSYQVASSIVPKNRTTYSRLRNNITDTSPPYRLPRAPSATTVVLRIASPRAGPHHLRHC